MLVEGGHEVYHHDHWGRRLMASLPDGNETEEKNCTEPGKSEPVDGWRHRWVEEKRGERRRDAGLHPYDK